MVSIGYGGTRKGRVRWGAHGGCEGGSGGSRERRRGESDKIRCRMVRMGMGVEVVGGRGRRRSCTVVRRECWHRRWGVRRS